jgi:tRNA threonylcarbamoyladenosine biosynthesis protein TsaB
MTRLAIDCSTARGSVALASEDGPLLWQAAFTAGRGQGGKLFAALAESLQVAAATGDGKLAGIVVGLGPGSYSGVRQAIAAATGLSVATGASLAGVPSPLGLETGASVYQSIGDARRGTFYYTAVERGVCVVGPLLVESREALAAQLAQRPDWPLLTVECALDDALFAAAEVALPDAGRLLGVPAAQSCFLPLEPLYLRPPAITLRPVP